MGFTPDAFYRLQYSELLLIFEGRRARHRRESRERREENAWIVSWLLLPHKGKDADPITPAQLMGRKPRAQAAKFATDEDAARAYFAAQKAQSKKRLSDGK